MKKLLFLFVLTCCVCFCVPAEAKTNPMPTKRRVPVVETKRVDKATISARDMGALCYGKIERVVCGEDFKVFITKDWLRADLRARSVPNPSDAKRVGEWCFVAIGGDWKVCFVDDERDADFTVYID